MPKGFFIHFFKSAIALIYVIIINFMKVVAYVYIIKPILVKISNGNTQSIPKRTADNTGFFGYIGEMISIISEKLSSAYLAAGP